MSLTGKTGVKWPPGAQQGPRLASRATSLIERVRLQTAAQPAANAITFLLDGETSTEQLTYGELGRRVGLASAWLGERSLRRKRCLLLFPPGPEYVVALLGCLAAGAVAVPAYPLRGRRSLPRLLSILDDARPESILTLPSLRQKLQGWLADTSASGIPILEVGEGSSEGIDPSSQSLPGVLPTSFEAPSYGDLAVLQYTSGSTSAPKGVMLTHGNLLANQEMIGQAFGTGPQAVVVSWLPLYHDMGLIGGLLHPLYLGCHCVLMAPHHFLQRPRRWLEAIARFRGTISGGPNFAYDLCVDRVDPGGEEPLDLSSWEVAFNGSEPVQDRTQEAFSERFRSWGFEGDAFFPCYGLAEATLLVTGAKRGEGPPRVSRVDGAALEQHQVRKPVPKGEERPVVSSGAAPAGVEVRVVDPASGVPRSPGMVGEIWVAGAGISPGYLGRSRETAEGFTAAAQGQRFLRTGDLGFMDSGELFVTGRCKDLIILRGRNLYPHDIERLGETAHAALRRGCGAAFAVSGPDGEELVVALEVNIRAKPDFQEVLEAVRGAIAEGFEVQPRAVVLCRPGAVPKTTSGKVQRRRCRELYLTEQLAVVEMALDTEGNGGVEQTRSATFLEQEVRRHWAEILELPLGDLTEDSHFFAAGGDSLSGARLLQRLEESVGRSLTLERLFEVPTVRGMVACLREISATGKDWEVLPPLEAGPRDGSGPPSSQQQRLWFLDQLQPGNPAYNLAVALDFPRLPRSEDLATRLRRTVRRQRALRTGFHIRDGHLVQETQPVFVSLPTVDLSALEGPARRREGGALEVAAAARPFDLSRPPLLRLLLVRLPDGAGRLILTLHHIISDAWSLGVLSSELMGEEPPPLPIQAVDHARWQRQVLESGVLEPQLEYWRRHLEGAPTVLELPGDRPRPPVLGNRGAHFSSRLGKPLSESLQAFGNAHSCTTFTVLAATYIALLFRYMGLRDMLVGTAVANRRRPALEPLVGFFVNTLPLRAQVQGDPSFLDLVTRLGREVLAMQEHQEVPFERLVEEIAPQRDLSHTPLVQVMLVFQNALRGADDDRLFTAREVDNGTARFDLALSMRSASESLEGTWKYSRDLFDESSIFRMAQHFRSLMKDALARPELALGDLSLLSRAERHQLQRGWNDTRHSYPQGEGTLVDLLSDQVRRTPQGVAVELGEEVLTYDHLYEVAVRLSVQLRKRGVGADEVVGVVMERSLELVIALVAIHRAGGAYLPLDPAYPRKRLRLMAEDGGVELVLTQRHLLSRAPEGRTTLIVDDPEAPWRNSGTPASTFPMPPLDPSNLAYVIFTSGSTGRPKGVAVSHRAIVNRLLWMQRRYRLRVGEGVLHKTPLSFDVSVWELFWPLVVGGRLVLAKPQEHRDSAALAARIIRHQVTTLHFVPSMLQVFCQEPALERCTSLERVIASGEALSPALVRRFQERSSARLDNLYGPTEAAVDVTVWSCPQPSPSSVFIGRPIDNIRTLVLDDRGRLVPLGVTGELYLGGVGLARGYQRRPALTAERFVPDSLTTELGGRLYRTGDLVRLQKEGEIEYLQRRDHQVKLRGLRVELGEIEATLTNHKMVREAVVVLRTGTTGASRLVAYVVGFAGELCKSGPLLESLGEELPQHMVPSHLIVLESMPLTSSGKVDRRALPDLETEHTSSASSLPQTPVERRLAALWLEQLGLEQLGVEDDFFDLGGDSIQAALLINRLQRELDSVLYVMALFDAPTVRALADYLEHHYREALDAAGWSLPEAITFEESSEPPLPENAGERFRRHLATTFGASKPAIVEEKNSPAVFILAPFRSGSTLLRVMLAGHSGLFAPPELELLGFSQMAERRRLLAGRWSFAREGLQRAIMELTGENAAGAAARIATMEEQEWSTARAYRSLQEQAAPRVLVDKTPRYALDRGTLDRAEAWFQGARYIHLLRHPCAMAHSYVEANMDRVYDYPFSPRQQAELIWTECQRNIVSFLGEVPAERWVALSFEDLVRQPEREMERVCDFLGIPFEAALLEPYRGHRMTDGLVAEGRMMGDPRFHRHRHIEAAVADRWRGKIDPRQFSQESWQLAETLGYRRRDPRRAELVPVCREDEPLGLSLAQERMWFLAHLHPTSAAYNMPAAVLLEGPLDSQALEGAFNEIENRHEILRSTFPRESGRPRLKIRSPGGIRMRCLDLSGLSERQGDTVVEHLKRKEGSFLFALEHGPMLRLTLIRQASEHHVLLVTLHHLVADGWSIAVLIREFKVVYDALRTGSPASLSPLPVQYADYAAAQRRWLASGEMEAQLGYWRQRLEGLPPSLDLPMDRARPHQQSYRGHRLPVRFSIELGRSVERLAKEHGVTLFVALAAVFQILLMRLSGQRDIALGTPVANRNRMELEGLIGLFVNTVVLRSDLRRNPSLGDLLRRLQRETVDAFRHQEVPFGKVVEALQPQRALDRSPLVQVLFAFQNGPAEPLETQDLVLTPLDVDNGTAKFDLGLSLWPLEGALTGFLETSADLFDATTAARFARAFGALLESAVGHPRRPVSALSMLAPEELHQFRWEWNDSAASRSLPCLHSLIEAQAARTPEAVAVVGEAEILTYRQLLDHSSRLGRELRRRGVGPDVVVALSADRSPAMMIALVAILRAGGAYLPLDPGYPKERLLYMMEHAGASVHLGQGSALDGHFATGATEFLDLDVFLNEALEPPVTALPRSSVRPENLTYVIYTSGSTGRPKGAMVSHRAIVNRLLWMQSAYRLEFGEGVLHKTPISFDVSVWELFWPLICGARVVLARPGGHRDGDYLARRIAEQEVTTAHFVPSMLEVFLKARGLEACTSLRRVIASGEALSPALKDRFYQLLPGELHNLYGPTEAAVDVTAWRCRTQEEEVPIGRPIENLRVHILDPRDLSDGPVPLGVGGELQIGGVGLARGYLGSPRRTAERFIPDPLAEISGQRLYRTGDLAKYRSGGEIEFLGRLDHQIKLRGFRIETGEIEAALRDQAAVSEGVVLLRGDLPGGDHLVAYAVAADPGSPPSPEGLRAALRERLPEYMVPTYFVFLPRLPTTPNGKLDRKALPVPGRLKGVDEFISPRGALEEVVANIWQEVLEVERVGAQDNFFDLGGHSLLAVDVHSRLEERLNRRLSLTELFRFPTVDTLAQHLTSLRSGEGRGEEESLAAVQQTAARGRAALAERRAALRRRAHG